MEFWILQGDKNYDQISYNSQAIKDQNYPKENLLQIWLVREAQEDEITMAVIANCEHSFWSNSLFRNGSKPVARRPVMVPVQRQEEEEGQYELFDYFLLKGEMWHPYFGKTIQDLGTCFNL